MSFFLSVYLARARTVLGIQTGTTKAINTACQFDIILQPPANRLVKILESVGTFCQDVKRIRKALEKHSKLLVVIRKIFIKVQCVSDINDSLFLQKYYVHFSVPNSRRPIIMFSIIINYFFFVGVKHSHEVL